MDLESREKRLNEMVLKGEALDAFEEFYAEDCVMAESAGRWEGKDTNREREKDFFSKITELRGVEHRGGTVDEENNRTYSEWHFDYTHEEWGDVKYDQIAVRDWNEDGEIVRERFFKID